MSPQIKYNTESVGVTEKAILGSTAFNFVLRKKTTYCVPRSYFAVTMKHLMSVDKNNIGTLHILCEYP